MASITQQGALNTTALVVPDLYVQIVPPQNLVINGVPTNVIGVVGTAQWGPVNQPVIIGSMQQYAQSFGALQNRKYDMGTAVAIACQQGAQAFKCVRVTDGTDVAATCDFNLLSASWSVVFTAKYSGTLGNSLTASLAAGSKASSWKLTIGIPGQVPEVYDNLTGTTSAFWTGLIAAVNNGNSATRGPSQLVVASAGTGTQTSVAPAVVASTAFTGGTDGVTTLTASVLVGSSASLTYTGMYTLTAQGCSIGMLADADDSTQWTAQAAFGQAQGIYMMLVAPAGTAIANGTTGTVDLKATAGLDNYGAKLIHGDWVYWQDQVNNVIRLVSPQGFFAGRLGNLSPEQSSLNKQMYYVIGTQTSSYGNGQASTYNYAQLQALFQVGIDVIANPCPGGNYFGARLGHNSSSNAATNGDNYTRMTNYIAATLAAGMGVFDGQVITTNLFNSIRGTLLSFLQNLLSQGLLGTTTGALPYSVICDITNNPLSRTSLGYVQADVAVQYMGINEKFIINLQGGQTVVTTSQTTPSGQVV